MNIQQLRYVIAVAEDGSMSRAAERLFTSQASLSTAIKALEREMGLRIFSRSNRGASLTNDGVEFLSYARQVVEQADLLEQRWLPGSGAGGRAPRRLSVSCQHYAFAVRAFIAFVAKSGADPCEFTLRETRTSEIIEDVSTFRSDVGILYLSSYNEDVMRHRLEERQLAFRQLFSAKPHVFVREGHPLAALGRPLRLRDLARCPRYTFEQGSESSLYLFEEPLSEHPHERRIVASDRATMTGLLLSYDGFLVSTGVRSDEMLEGIVSLPLETEEVMRVGTVVRRDRSLGALALSYLDQLDATIDGLEADGAITRGGRA